MASNNTVQVSHEGGVDFVLVNSYKSDLRSLGDALKRVALRISCLTYVILVSVSILLVLFPLSLPPEANSYTNWYLLQMHISRTPFTLVLAWAVMVMTAISGISAIVTIINQRWGRWPFLVSLASLILIGLVIVFTKSPPMLIIPIDAELDSVLNVVAGIIVVLSFVA